MGINTKLLAGVAVVVLLLGVSSQIANHAFAFTSTEKYSDSKAIAKAAGEHAVKVIAAQQKNKITPPRANDGTG
jgi:hypothetical protein